MKSKKCLLFVIIAEFLVIILLVYNAFSEYRGHQYVKELFINKSYFLLKDVSENIETENYDDVIFNLAELDAIFTMFRQENGDFYYRDPGFWRVLANNIRSNGFTDLASINSEIHEIITNLSDSTGIAENSELSYKELNDIFNPIYSYLE